MSIRPYQYKHAGDTGLKGANGINGTKGEKGDQGAETLNFTFIR